MASPATRIPAVQGGEAVPTHTAGIPQRAHQGLGGDLVLEPPRSQGLQRDHRPVDVRQEADRVEHPLVERADGRRRGRARRPAPAPSRGARPTGPSVAAPRPAGRRAPRRPRRDPTRRPRRGPPQPRGPARRTAGRARGPRWRPGPAARTGRPRGTRRATGCVRNAFIGGHSGRGTKPGDDGNDAIHTATTGARTACGTTAARRSTRSWTATSTRAYFPVVRRLRQ